MNAEDAYLSSIHSWSFFLFSVDAGIGRDVGGGVVVTWLGMSRVSDPLWVGKWLVQMITDCQVSGISQPLESSDQ